MNPVEDSQGPPGPLIVLGGQHVHILTAVSSFIALRKLQDVIGILVASCFLSLARLITSENSMFSSGG